MTIEPGQVYLVDLGMAAKVRPMVVISRKDPDAPRALSVCVPITTSSRNSPYEVVLGKPKFLRETSFANVQGLQAIQHHELKRFLGQLSGEALSDIRQAMAWMLEISE